MLGAHQVSAARLHQEPPIPPTQLRLGGHLGQLMRFRAEVADVYHGLGHREHRAGPTTLSMLIPTSTVQYSTVRTVAGATPSLAGVVLNPSGLCASPVTSPHTQ